MSTPARHQSTTPRHRLGQAPDQHHAREIIHRVREEDRLGAAQMVMERQQ